MKRTLKLFVTIVVASVLVLATVFSFAACSSTKVLKMGTNAAFPPFESKEGSGYTGIDIEISQKIAEKLGMKLEVVDMDFDALLDALNGGKCDFVAAGMTVRPDREQQVDFTTKYYRSTQVVIVPKDNTAITSQDSLQNLKIGVQAGTTGEEAAKNIKGAQVSSFQNGSEAILALNNKQVDAIVIDAEPAKNFVSVNANLKTVEVGFDDEYYAMAVKKGNTDLYKKIDGALQELIKDGSVDKIVAKYTSK